MNRRQRIMMVDDDRDILKMLGRALELEGFEVSAAEDGRTALKQLDTCRPDLIILDIVMPDLNGFQVLDLIRRRSNVPVIMLTGTCQVTSLRDAIVLGADDYVNKPFRIRELAARVRAKLRRANMVPRYLSAA